MGKQQSSQNIDPVGKGAITASLILHGAVFLFAIFGLPSISKDLPEPAPIQIIDVSLIAPKPQETAEEKPAPKPKPPKATAPPKMTAEAPPDLSKKREPVPEVTQPPPAPAETMPEPEAPAPPRSDIKPPPERPKMTKTAPPEPEDNQDFTSLLKNLMDTPPPSEESDEQAEEDKEAKPAPVAQQMSFSEIEAVRGQLASCWTVLSGARYAEDLVVKIRLTMNRDRTIQRAVIEDQSRYNNDAYFKAAADSAVRALYQPACKHLKLPEDKYDQWKSFTINFDPRKIL